MIRFLQRSAILFALTVFLVGGASAAGFTTTALLSGASENPPTATTASGLATLTYDSIAETLSYSITFSDLTSGLVQGHIHVGAIGTNGPVILPFAVGAAAGQTSGAINGVLTAANLIPRPAAGINTFDDAITAVAIGNAYVNLHTTTFPGGEIRGQVAAAAPEPGAILLLGAGLPLLAIAVRRRLRG